MPYKFILLWLSNNAIQSWPLSPIVTLEICVLFALLLDSVARRMLQNSPLDNPDIKSSSAAYVQLYFASFVC